MSTRTPLEETFDLPSIDDVHETIEGAKEVIEYSENTIVNHTDDSIEVYKEKMSHIHHTALSKFESLYDLSTNMEPAHGSKFLQSAAKLLEIAKNSQDSMMDKMIKLQELQLKKEKQDSELKGMIAPPTTINDDMDDESVPENVVGNFNRNNLLEEKKKQLLKNKDIEDIED